MARRFLSRPPALPPGTRFAYSNYGYLIIGHLLERVTGAAWEDLIRREVFESLAMAGCGLGATALVEQLLAEGASSFVSERGLEWESSHGGRLRASLGTHAAYQPLVPQSAGNGMRPPRVS